ncbi:MAG: DUF4430 domain-containing protein [Oscillospiraceae bacterium]|nr:DUF4430 domain-containing protein [Oscillospiraceae bacterium]
MNKKIWIAVVAVVAVIGIMAGVWFATRQTPTEGEKIITVKVVHKDGTTNNYVITTEAETLAEAMNERNLLGEDDNGMYYTIDGETTDYSVDESWWCLYVDGESSMEGANTISITDGTIYEWVYTIGWG